MISVSRFTLLRKGADVIATGQEDIPCPECGGKLGVHGTCRRKLKGLSGETNMLRLRVMECSACGITHRELIEGIVPYKRYSIDLLCAICEAPDAGIADSSVTDEHNDDKSHTESQETPDAYICEESTRNRFISWVSWFLAYMNEIGLGQSQSRQGQKRLSLTDLLKKGIREIVNSGRWKIQHHFMMQSS